MNEMDINRVNDKRKRPLPGLLRFSFMALVLLFVFALLLSFFPDLLFPRDRQVAYPGRVDIASGETINIVLLGFDRTAARKERSSIFRPDTILIAAIDYKNNRVSMVSILRDSYVEIHNTGIFDKINHSYMYGYISAGEGEDSHRAGLDATLLTVQDFLGGLPLHGYMVIDIEGAEAVVDAIGGVYLDVEEDVRTEYGRGRLLVDKGYQLLDGRKFMHYVRSRADNLGGERGRTLRQQKGLIALFRKVLSPAGLLNSPAFLEAIYAAVESDLTLPRMLNLALFGLRINPDQISTAAFAGEGRLSDRGGQNIYYLVIDENYRLALIKEVFNVVVDERAVPYLPGPLADELEPVDEIEPEMLLQPELQPEPDIEEEPDPVEDLSDKTGSDIPVEPELEQPSEIEPDLSGEEETGPEQQENLSVETEAVEDTIDNGSE